MALRRLLVTVVLAFSGLALFASLASAVPAGPTVITAPTVSGNPTQGKTLRAWPGVWSGSSSFSYQWQQSSDLSGWADITGATSRTYTLNSYRVGKYVRVKVTAAGSPEGVAYSEASPFISAATVRVSPVSGVNAQAQTVTNADGMTYVGGSEFTAANPVASGSGALFRTQGSGVKPVQSFPQVTGGSVLAAQPDGDGGFYIGGTFTHVGGTSQPRLAHILANGSLDDSFTPSQANQVNALAVYGGRVYAGASGGNYLRVYDEADGSSIPGVDSLNGAVYALKITGGKLYVGGAFTDAGGATKQRLAVADLDGKFDINYRGLGSTLDGPVYDLEVDGTTLYFAGSFSAVDGETRNNLAAVEGPAGSTPGQLTSFDPNVDGSVEDLQLSGSDLYLGGSFANVGGNAHQGAALVDSSGAVQAWNPQLNGGVSSLALLDGVVYMVGGFTAAGSANRYGAAAVSGAGALQDWSPSFSTLTAPSVIAGFGATLYLGGNFSYAGGTPRRGIAAFDSDGKVSSLQADLGDTGSVSAIEVGGGHLYIAGSFSSVDGSARGNAAAFTITTSPGGANSYSLDPWNPNADQSVNDLLYMSGRGVYLAGSFSNLDSTSRPYLGLWSESDGMTAGSLDSFDAQVSGGAVRSLTSISAGTIYAGGNFSSVNGSARQGLAEINDLNPGVSLGALNPDFQNASSSPVSAVRQVVTDGADLYVAGSFYKVGATVRPGAAAFQTDGTLLSWDPSPDQSPFAVNAEGGGLYLGGDFATIGASSRVGFAATDSAGAATTPVADLASPGSPLANSIDLEGGDVYLAGDFSQVSSTDQANITKFDSTTGAVASWPSLDSTAASATWTEPSSPTSDSSLLFTLDFDETVYGLGADDFENLGTATGCSFSVSGASGSSFTVTASGCSDGSVEVRLYSDSVVDNMGNYSPSANTDSAPVTIDRTGPEVLSFTTAEPNPTNSSSVDYTLVFDESVSGVADGDFSDAGSAGCSLSVAGSGDTYTVTATGCSSGTLTPRLAASSASDGAGNLGPASASDGSSIVLDYDKPQVSSFTASTSSPTTSSTVLYDLTFDESVSGLAGGDFTNLGSATGCSFSVTGSGDTYVVTASSCSEGTVEPQLGADLVEDAAGNLGPASNQSGSVVEIDNTPASVTTFSTAFPSPSSAASIDYVLQFDESVTGLSGSAFQNTGSATGCSFSVSGSGASYTVTVSSCSSGTLVPRLNAGTVSDPAGNLSPAVSADGSAITLDYTAPSVTDFSTATVSPTNSTSVVYDLTFDESVSGVEDGDFSNAGAATGCSFSVTGSGDTYTLTVSSCSSGELTPRLASGSYTDAAGNQGPQADGETITLDYDKPTLAWAEPSSPRAVGPMTYTLNFSEPVDVTSLTVGDLDLAGSGCSITSITPAGTGAYESSFDVLISGCSTGQVELGLLADSVSDEASNLGPAVRSDASSVTVVIIPVNTSPPSISGTAEVGEVLFASPGGWDYSPTSYAYQWKRCKGASCSNVGTNSDQYTLTAQDTGATIKVSVSATNVAGTSSPVDSSETAEVEGPPVNFVAPTITGSTWVSGALSLDTPGQWYATTSTSITYQWQRSANGSTGWVDIAGETNTTYTLAPADDGKFIRLLEIADSGAQGSASSPSDGEGPVRVQDPPVNVSLPTVPASPGQGDFLLGNDGTWSGDELSYDYQWMSCTDTTVGSCTPIPSATGLGYTAQAGDVGNRLRLMVSAYNLAVPLPGVVAYSDPSNPVNPPPSPPSNTVKPSISGTARVNQTLTADPGSWDGFPAPTFEYQWIHCDGSTCLPISGADDPTYTIDAAYTGETIKVEVTAKNSSAPAGVSETSDPTSPVAPLDPPVAATAPSLPANGLVGAASSVTAGTYNTSVVPVTLSYVWFACDLAATDANDASCAAIPSQVSGSYTPASEYAGKQLFARETATNEDGQATQDTGGMVVEQTPTATTSPSFTGEAREGQTLTGSDGTWAGYPAPSLSRQWVVCTDSSDTSTCSDLSGETGSTYTLTASEVGKYVRFKVTGSATINSAPVSTDEFSASQLVLPLPPANTAPPSITGTLRETYTLTASNGSWDHSPTSYSYEWQSCTTSGDASSCSPVGTDSNTFTLTSSEVDKYMRVKVTATNAGGSGNQTSDYSVAVAEFLPPANTTPPAVSGYPRVGRTLTVTNGSWTGTDPINFTRQWMRCQGVTCDPIGSESGFTYTLTEDDLGYQIKVQVNASNDDGALSIDSNLTSVVASPLSLPAPTLTSQPAARSKITTVAFTGDSGASFECSVDGGAYSACVSPFSPVLSDGAHTIAVRQKLEDQTSAPATASFVLDTAAPAAPSILEAPAASTSSRDARLVFSGEEAASFECRLDGSAWGSCSSPVSYSSLADGSHTFEVRQTDLAGNTSPAASASWTVSQTPDPVEPSDVKVVLDSQISVSASGQASIGCSADGAPVEACSAEAYVYRKQSGQVRTAAYRRVKVGFGRASADSEVSRLAVKVKLNKTGRSLLARHRGPMKTYFKATASFKGFDPVTAKASARLVPTRQVVAPSGGMFYFGSSTPSRGAKRFISRLRKNLPRRLKKITCTGNTDSIGSTEVNYQLGLQRAQAICSLLRAKGVRANYSVKSAGESSPRASNATARGRSLNRRVVITLRYR